MSLGDREHVEAVAIIRNLILALGADRDEYAEYCVAAGEQWLVENHPTPESYIAALRGPECWTTGS